MYGNYCEIDFNLLLGILNAAIFNIMKLESKRDIDNSITKCWGKYAAIRAIFSYLLYIKIYISLY